VFGLAVLIVVIWTLTGPLFGFSGTWQLVINTSTTIVTFLMVFLIQNTQKRPILVSMPERGSPASQKQASSSRLVTASDSHMAAGVGRVAA
jgi:hypothetical protein